MQVVLSSEADAIIHQKVAAAEFASPDEAVEVSVRLLEAGSGNAIDQSREQLRQALLIALDDSSNGISRYLTADQFLECAHKRKPSSYQRTD